LIHCPNTFFKINRAKFTLFSIAITIRGVDVLMSSRASRTAAVIEAAITIVDAYRSCFLRSYSSYAIARVISPIFATNRQTVLVS
jgi:hypothetical protein